LFTNISGGNSGGLALSNTMPGWYAECDAVEAGAQIGASDGSTTNGGIYSFGAANSGNRALGLIATTSSQGTHFGLKLINTSGNDLNFICLQYTGEYWASGMASKTLSLGYTVDPAGIDSTLSADNVSNAVASELNELDISFPTGDIGPVDGSSPANQAVQAENYIFLNTPWSAGQALWLVWSIEDPTEGGQGYGIDNFKFFASANHLPGAIQPSQIGNPTFSSVNGTQFTFNNAPGAGSSLTVWVSSDITRPFNSWQNLGSPTEISFGTYQFTDPSATSVPARYYRVVYVAPPRGGS